ncbi:unnamed protein product [Gadus morhua 'NCC']
MNSVSFVLKAKFLINEHWIQSLLGHIWTCDDETGIHHSLHKSGGASWIPCLEITGNERGGGQQHCCRRLRATSPYIERQIAPGFTGVTGHHVRQSFRQKLDHLRDVFGQRNAVPSQMCGCMGSPWSSLLSCKTTKVHVVCFPPHTTHTLQPAGRAVFKSSRLRLNPEGGVFDGEGWNEAAAPPPPPPSPAQPWVWKAGGGQR